MPSRSLSGIPLISNLLARTGAAALSLSVSATCALSDVDSGAASEWTRFHSKEIAPPSAPLPTGTTQQSDGSAATSGKGQFQPVQQGYFTVPGYFANPPQPYERPQEFFRTPTLTEGSAQANAGLNSFAATLPFTLGGGAGPWGYRYGGWGGWPGGPGYWGGPYGFYGTPFAGSGIGAALLGASAAGMAGGAAPLPTFGFGWGSPAGLPGAVSPYGRGYWGGWGAPYAYGGEPRLWGGWGAPYAYGGAPGLWGGWGAPYAYGGEPRLWGGGPWGWYGGGFGAAALGASAAFGAGGSQTGVVTPTRVFQTAPSKPSGNYYAPSTADPSASGGYYATTAPAAIPMIPQKKTITDFWGTSGSPLPKDINSVPWAK